MGILYYELGVRVGIPLIWLITSKIGVKPKSTLLVHALRIALRCLAFAVAFAPTAFTASPVALLLPASVVLDSS
jgi:hypothetical protein